MKTNVLKIGLIALMVGGLSLASCETESELSAGTLASLVSVDADGTTLINSDDLKSLDPGTADLTDAEIEWLKFMREEEKLARDLYLALGETYKVPIFKNIARAEANHMNAVLTILTSYSIEDPASTEPGVFNNAELQTLYNTLLEAGKPSLIDALKVGALVEETDILDLAKVYELTPGEDLTGLTEALMLGSRNHLRAFTRVLKVNGVEYVPVALDIDLFTEIVTSDWERGTGFCRGTIGSEGCKYLNGSGRGFYCRK